MSHTHRKADEAAWCVFRRRDTWYVAHLGRGRLPHTEGEGGWCDALKLVQETNTSILFAGFSWCDVISYFSAFKSLRLLPHSSRDRTSGGSPSSPAPRGGFYSTQCKPASASFLAFLAFGFDYGMYFSWAKICFAWGFVSTFLAPASLSRKVNATTLNLLSINKIYCTCCIIIKGGIQVFPLTLSNSVPVDSITNDLPLNIERLEVRERGAAALRSHRRRARRRSDWVVNRGFL